MLKFSTVLYFVCLALPAYAHEGSAGEHLILGLDTGIVVGTAVGFVAGVVATTIARKYSKR